METTGRIFFIPAREGEMTGLFREWLVSAQFAGVPDKRSPDVKSNAEMVLTGCLEKGSRSRYNETGS